MSTPSFAILAYWYMTAPWNLDVQGDWRGHSIFPLLMGIIFSLGSKTTKAAKVMKVLEKERLDEMYRHLDG